MPDCCHAVRKRVYIPPINHQHKIAIYAQLLKFICIYQHKLTFGIDNSSTCRDTFATALFDTSLPVDMSSDFEE